MSEATELMDVVKQTAFNVAGISEQMGILTTEIKNIKLEQRRQAEGPAAVNDRMQNYEDRIRVSRSEAQNIRRSIHGRVCDLLNIHYINGVVASECIYDDKFYRGRFISRCYVDARKESRLGTPYYETYCRDYQEVLDYIARWVPPTGVEGYKAYLEIRMKK